MTRPIKFPIEVFPHGLTSYGVRVAFRNGRAEITAFANSADAWAAGVEALAQLVEYQNKEPDPMPPARPLHVAPPGAKAVEYDVRLSLEELNALANLVGFHLEPEDGARPIRGETLQRCATRLAQAKKA